jgi:hypothetical protein
MDTDFGNVAGGGFDEVKQFTQTFITSHWMGVAIAFLILCVLVIAFFFGWIGTAAVKNKETFVSCAVGNQSALCRQGRDGPGESLENSALASGYAADPTAFCTGAGEPTDDPWGYLQTTLTGTGGEELTQFDAAAAMDRNLMIANQH